VTTVRLAPSVRALVAVWLAVALAGVVLVLVVERSRGPLDDPDPARQRPGLLDTGSLPLPAPSIGGLEYADGPTVAFFARPAGVARLCRALSGDGLGGGVQVAVVLAAPEDVPLAGGCGAVAHLVVGPALAEGFGMPVPADGGYPVGYAIVDTRGRTRYRTLDPSAAARLDEVATVLGAVP